MTGASSVLDAVTTMPCDADSGLLGFLGSAAGAAVLGAALARRWPGWDRVQLALGIGIASCGLADLMLLLMSDSIGTTERVRVLLTSGWFLAVGLFLLSQAPSARRVHRGPQAPGRGGPGRARGQECRPA